MSSFLVSSGLGILSEVFLEGCGVGAWSGVLVGREVGDLLGVLVGVGVLSGVLVGCGVGVL